MGSDPALIAGAGAMASGFLSLMALCFPLLYALTARPAA
jgi:gamma-F420-2:alpha-L-glutamate ligase